MAADPEYMAREVHKLKTFPRVLVDFETRSIAPFGKRKDSVGADKYAEHPSTQILCMSYKIGSAPAKLWWAFFGEAFPYELIEAIEAGWVFEAHNTAFERAIWRNILVKQYGVPMPETWTDTMASCAYRAIPMGLDDAANVLDLKHKKNPRGSLLIRKLCSPQKMLKAEKKAGLESIPGMPGFKWNNDETLMREMGVYCLDDAEAEYDLGQAVHDLPPSEYAVWRLDQEINERGVYIDIDAVKCADIIRRDVEEILVAELIEITRDPVTGQPAVQTGGELEAMSTWCAQHGVMLPDMTADTLELYLNPHKAVPLPPEVKRVLQIRQVLSRASAKKIIKFISMLCEDGRIRGMLAYHGAGTGRWAGRGVQPQNFPRPDEFLLSVCKKANGKPDAAASMELLIRCILTSDHETLSEMYGDPMNALASALRGFIIAEPGNELYVADFSAIEARVLAWVAGEQWKLDAFAAIDRGEGYKGSADIYLATASKVYGYPCIDKTTHHAERQTGKTCLGADTRVLTSSGIKRIVEVQTSDSVWDGTAWVNHQGVISQGVKLTIEMAGVRVTPDHPIFTGRLTSCEAGVVASQESILCLALANGSESLPSSVATFAQRAALDISSLGAPAVVSPIKSCSPIWCKAALQGVIAALIRQPATPKNSIGGWLKFCLTMATDAGSSTAYRPLSRDATAGTLTNTTACAESKYKNLGERTRESFSRISSLLRDGTTPYSTSTGSKRTKDTNGATSSSLRDQKTVSTNEKSEICNEKLTRFEPVYDLVNAGPDHRFTVITDRGPVVLANCELAFGYQGGVGAWRKFDDSDKWTDDEVDEKKKAWRAEHPMTQAFWYQIEDTAVEAVKSRRPCTYRGITFQVVKSSVGDWLACRLPNGRCLWYLHPWLDKVPSKYGKFVGGGQREPFKYELHYEGKDNKRGGSWDDVKTYGGMLTENIVQAISRDIMVEAMFRVTAAGYPIVLTIHDEIVAERRKNSGGSGKEFNALMSIVLDWTPGLPISVAGYISTRYRKD